MNILLVVRSEIISLFILLFFIVYNQVCSKYREGKDYFITFALTSLGHTILGLITEITVNQENFPRVWNDFFHILFFICALLFTLKYFEYSLSLIMPKKYLKRFMAPTIVISGLCIVVMIVAPIHYLQGVGTKYSAGIGPTVCYLLGFFLMLLSDFLILIYHKKINSQTVYLLIPLSFLTLIFLGVQIVVPEFLFTGCALTITVVGVFFAIENPIGKFQSRAFIDTDTQTWNKSCYEYDIENKYNKDNIGEITYIIADINGLKPVNDNLGHLEGDKLIKACCNALMDAMTQAYRIYRIGGDEFVALYIDKPMDTVLREIEDVHIRCIEQSKKEDFIASVSIGYAKREKDESMADVFKRADAMMYEEKNKYYRENRIDRRRTSRCFLEIEKKV